MTTKQPTLRQQHNEARLKFEIADFQRRSKILAKYDATEPNRLRRQPQRETKPESGIYDMSKRLLGCNLGRDLERNYSPARSMLHQFRVNVVGDLGKLRINTPDGEEATSWFNEVWSKDCDFREDADWSTMLQNILAAEIRDGDMLAIIDDNLIEDSGKLLTWESDQIVPVSETLFAASAFKDHTQDNGIVRTKNGKIVAYSVTGKRGMSVIDTPEDVTYWKREEARLVRNPWRLNQGRGVPSILTPAANFIDLYEILSSELQTAKRAAKQYAFVKRDNAVTDWDTPANSPEYLPENDGRTATDVAADGANQATHTARNYEKLESFSGGLTDYLDPADTVEIPDIKRPNANLAAFLEAIHGYSGAALGMARAYSILRADSSYTAFRGDMLMTWITFYWLQKHLERAIADWVATRVITWAIRKGEVKPMAKGWERRISFAWPTMPEVNPVDYQNSVALALKNATTDYGELLGPDWERRLRGLGEQINVIRELNLPAGVLETKSGGNMETGKDNENETRRVSESNGG